MNPFCLLRELGKTDLNVFSSFKISLTILVQVPRGEAVVSLCMIHNMFTAFFSSDGHVYTVRDIRSLAFEN